MAVKRSVEELNARVQSFIKEQFHRHPSGGGVALPQGGARGLERAGRPPPPPSWSRSSSGDVYPLYALSDIRGSSTHRARAIQADLLTQLRLAREVLRAAHDARALPVLDQLPYRIDPHAARSSVTLARATSSAGDASCAPTSSRCFDHLPTFGEPVRERIEAYRAALDAEIGLVYARAKSSTRASPPSTRRSPPTSTWRSRPPRRCSRTTSRSRRPTGSTTRSTWAARSSRTASSTRST